MSKSKMTSKGLNFLFQERNLTLDFVPILPRELLSYRIALYTGLFSDAGATKFKGEALSLNDFKKGYGAGLTLLILPYNVVRFEVGLDEYHNTEYLFNVAVSF